MNKALTVVGIVLFLFGAAQCGSYVYSMTITQTFANMASMIWAAAQPILYAILGLVGAVLACTGLILDAVGKREK